MITTTMRRVNSSRRFLLIWRRNTISRDLFHVLISVVSLVCMACSTVAVNAQQSNNNTVGFAPQFTTMSGDALISPGDLLSITVFDTPEFSGTIRVSNEGNLNLPLIGEVHLAGLTSSRASKMIRDKLIDGNYLKDPQVNVSFVDFINQSAVVLGEVSKPGPIPVLGARTLWETIGAAGGITSAAANRVIVIHRSDPGNPLMLSVNWDRNLADQPNPPVAPGDTVQVPRAGMVYVVGEVGRPGAFPILHEKLTLLQVVSFAEGVKYTSKATEARLIRTNPNGREILKVDIRALLSGKTPDFPLQNDDILYVPLSSSKLIISRGLEAAISVTTSLAVYRFQ